MRFKEKENNTPLPEAFKGKNFRSYVDMANFADEHNLPDGEYWIYNPQGGNLLTALRTLKRRGTDFWVEGRGNV